MKSCFLTGRNGAMKQILAKASNPKAGGLTMRLLLRYLTLNYGKLAVVTAYSRHSVIRRFSDVLLWGLLAAARLQMIYSSDIDDIVELNQREYKRRLLNGLRQTKQG